MPRKKQHRKKRVSVTIIAAIITFIGVLLAAVIQISPNVNIFRPSFTATSVSFIHYDDPLGIFSLEYPANFMIGTRAKTDEELQVIFVPIEYDYDKISLFQVGAIVVNVGRANTAPDLDRLEVNNGFLEGALPGLYSTGDYVLISNEKTERGFLVHYRRAAILTTGDKFKLHTYVLAEVEQTSLFMALFYVADENFSYYEDIIEHMFSSISWSPFNVEKYFSLPK